MYSTPVGAIIARYPRGRGAWASAILVDEIRGSFQSKARAGTDDSAVASVLVAGCDWPYGEHYCPEQPVTRAEMATFLIRALSLEPLPTQSFLDAGITAHEPNINAIAAAAITDGNASDGSLHCPEKPTRAEMATFLVRALGLEPIPELGFLDVGNTAHAPNVNAIAAAGITRGSVADGSLYCPTEPVSRGQMAAFLRRAVGTP